MKKVEEIRTGRDKRSVSLKSRKRLLLLSGRFISTVLVIDIAIPELDQC
jgi:hypothetical protein